VKQHARSTAPVTIAVAVLALVLGSFGTAVAGPALTKGKVKTIAAKVVQKQAPKLSVAHADQATQAAKAVAVQDGAVTGASVADGSLGAADLAAGVVPADGYLIEAMNQPTDPVAAPDSPELISRSFTLPRAGIAHVRMFGARFSASCSSGSATGGLYIDDIAVPGTSRSLQPTGSETAIELVGSLPLTQGAHTLHYGYNCAGGNTMGAAFINATWTVMLAAE
jgi:hypothetical protein